MLFKLSKKQTILLLLIIAGGFLISSNLFSIYAGNYTRYEYFMLKPYNIAPSTTIHLKNDLSHLPLPLYNCSEALNYEKNIGWTIYSCKTGWDFFTNKQISSTTLASYPDTIQILQIERKEVRSGAGTLTGYRSKITFKYPDGKTYILEADYYISGNYYNQGNLPLTTLVLVPKDISTWECGKSSTQFSNCTSAKIFIGIRKGSNLLETAVVNHPTPSTPPSSESGTTNNTTTDNTTPEGSLSPSGQDATPTTTGTGIETPSTTSTKPLQSDTVIWIVGVLVVVAILLIFMLRNKKRWKI